MICIPLPYIYEVVGAVKASEVCILVLGSGLVHFRAIAANAIVLEVRRPMATPPFKYTSTLTKCVPPLKKHVKPTFKRFTFICVWSNAWDFASILQMIRD